MKLLSWLKRPANILLVICTIAIATGVFFRIYNLTFPDKQVFDEVYFPVFANNYITHTSFYDVHPPMGKFVIAVGLLLFGNDPLGWRSMPLVFGLGIIGLMGYISWSLFEDKVTALITATFFAIDGAFIVYSRTGLMDGVLFFAIFFTFLLAIKLKKTSTTFWCGLLLGIAVAIKWPAVAVFLPMLWYAWKVGRWKELLASLPFAAFVYLLIVYIGQLLIRAPNALQETFLWNEQAFEYHLHVTATHPWGSPWWSWPLELRPVLFLYDTLPNGMLHVENTLGNPLIWWGATAVVLGSTIFLAVRWVKNKLAPWDHEIFPLLLGYYALWLPWMFIHRVIFLYHYLPSYGFALLLLAYWLGKLWKKGWHVAVIIFMILAFVVTINYLPFSVGWIPISQNRLQDMSNVKSWFGATLNP